MGFKTTIITEDYGEIKLPKWFIKKWKRLYYFGETYNGVKDVLLVSSKREVKMYNGSQEEILIDLQKIVKKENMNNLIIVMLHECGGITRVQIEKDKIRLSEPTGWYEVENITHDYCYGCSDLKT